MMTTPGPSCVNPVVPFRGCSQATNFLVSECLELMDWEHSPNRKCFRNKGRVEDGAGISFLVSYYFSNLVAGTRLPTLCKVTCCFHGDCARASNSYRRGLPYIALECLPLHFGYAVWF